MKMTLAPMRPGRENGMAVVLMLTVLALVTLYVGANCHWLHSLDRELKLTEKKQIRRLDALSATNAWSAPIGANAGAGDSRPRATP
jgi:hypothetical protein